MCKAQDKALFSFSSFVVNRNSGNAGSRHKQQSKPKPHYAAIAGVWIGFTGICRIGGLSRIGCVARCWNLNGSLLVAANLTFFMLAALFSSSRFLVYHPLETVSCRVSLVTAV